MALVQLISDLVFQAGKTRRKSSTPYVRLPYSAAQRPVNHPHPPTGGLLIQCSTETSEPPSPTNRWATHTVQHRDQWATLTHQQVGYSYSAAQRPVNHPHPPTGGVLITYIDQQSTLFLLVSRRHPLTGGAIWPNNDNNKNRPTKHSLSLLLSRPTFPQNGKIVIL